MSTDEPFFGDSDRTVIRPTPGRRGPARRQPEPAVRQPPPENYPPSFRAPPVSHIGGFGSNSLVDAAAVLLALVGRLRGTAAHPDVAALRDHVVYEIQSFEANARAQGAMPELVLAGRYGLCVLLDETVLNTPWGSDSLWSRETLLSTFHNETWGGEKFFSILDRMMQEPGKNLDLLELFYLCLALGFEGKYRVVERGRTKLDEIQSNLIRIIRMQRGEFERELSPHWLGVQTRTKGLIRYVPLWVIGAIVGALLISMYLAFRFTLNDAAYPVFQALGEVGRTPTEFTSPPPKIAAPSLGLEALLLPDVERGLITVNEAGGRATITIKGDGLFLSGSPKVVSDYKPLLGRIGRALEEVPGRILVVGHTDNVPIRSWQFQSNWDLSRARAVGVADVLAEHLSLPSRLAPDGKADTEPLVVNDTAENRAKNRRVEITLIAQ